MNEMKERRKGRKGLLLLLAVMLAFAMHESPLLAEAAEQGTGDRKLYGISGEMPCASAICLNTAPGSGSQEGSGEYWYVENSDGTVQITGYTGSDTEIEIPAVLDNGKQVTEVYFLDGCESLTGITIPEGVASLDKRALKNCENLVRISLPASMTQIGDEYDSDEIMLDHRAGRVFDGLSSLTDIHVAPGNQRYSSCDGILCVGRNSADVVRVPEGKTGTVAIPGDIKRIRVNAFQGCEQITEIVLSGETYAARDGFKGCSNLKRIRLSSDYTGSIIKRLENDDAGVGYFCSCQKFEEYVVEESNPDYFAKDGILYEGSYVVSCPVAKSGEAVIPPGITKIGMDAFSKCSQITKIVIPDGVTEISGYDYGSGISGCTSLQSIEIPASMAKMGQYAFSGCENLKDIYFKGSREQWDQITDARINKRLNDIGAVIHCSGMSAGTDKDDDSVTAIPVSDRYVTLPKTEFIYNGKPQTPSITVKDDAGQTIDTANYTVTYSGNINVGQASVTVAFKGKYVGTVTKKFTIVPKGTSISKLKAGRKSFTVKWKKQKTQTTGYEIRYSANEKMKKAVLLGKIKAKKTSRKISGLKAGKTYYVQIRTYQTVKGETYVSEWSKSRKVRTKK